MISSSLQVSCSWVNQADDGNPTMSSVAASSLATIMINCLQCFHPALVDIKVQAVGFMQIDEKWTAKMHGKLIKSGKCSCLLLITMY